MSTDDFPAPKPGFVITHFLVVSDQDRYREFYRSPFEAQVLLERDHEGRQHLVDFYEGGGPTDNKLTVTLETPPDPDRASAFLNIPVADIAQIYQQWTAKGAKFLTEPKDHGREIRVAVCDPDGHPHGRRSDDPSSRTDSD